MVGAKCKVSFDVPNSLASVHGFKRSIYDVGRHAGENLVNIMSANSILVHCNIIHYSYMRGTQAAVDYNFFPNAAPGQKILQAPHNLIYLPVTLSAWLTDQHGKLLDLQLVYFLVVLTKRLMVVEKGSIYINMINDIEYRNVKAMVST